MTRKHYPTSNPITKRHWILASTLIIVCSWITHTTTASISDNISNQQTELDQTTNLESELSTKQLLSKLSAPSLFGQQGSTYSIPSSIEDAGLDFSAQLYPFIIDGEYITEEIATADTPETKHRELTHKVKRGESLGLIFNKLQQAHNLRFNGSLANKIGKNELGKSLLSLSIGKTLSFMVNQNGELTQINYPLTPLKELIINTDGSDITDSRINDLPYEKRQQVVSGEINSSLYEAAAKSGLSSSNIMQMVHIFGWDIDFVLDIHKGDTFHIIYEDYYRHGKKVTNGNILAAEFTTQGQTYRAIRYTDPNGNSSYYTPEGKSMLGTFLRSPVEFSRISSKFSKKRFHPVLKKWRSHKGVDYAAARGTPIRSTASGRIAFVGRKGGYGKTVMINHGGKYKTLYAHMKGFARGIKSGKTVKQGDIIGYIGSTGLATGPHLHYEFRVNGVHKNPLTLKSPKASSIKKAYKSEFAQLTNKYMTQLDRASLRYLAKNNTQTEKL